MSETSKILEEVEVIRKADKERVTSFASSLRGVKVVVDQRLTGCDFYWVVSEEVYEAMKNGSEVSV